MSRATDDVRTPQDGLFPHWRQKTLQLFTPAPVSSDDTAQVGREIADTPDKRAKELIGRLLRQQPWGLASGQTRGLAMWHSGWVWFKTLRGQRATTRPDRCDMGIEIGLDESLESRLPPLLEVAASRPHDMSRGVSPLGTDHRSRFA